MEFFGKKVSDTGCEVLVKVGSRWADPKNPGHLISWRDGQIIQIMPLGFHTGKQVGYCCTLLKFPNIDYATIGGRWEKDWKKTPATATLWDKINHTVNADGKYLWEVMAGAEFESVRKTRDYFLDFKDLENQSLLTTSEKENIYDYDNKTIITISPTFNLETLVKHEEVDTRLDPSKLLQHASITTGTHSIGSGLDYDTVTAFEAAIGAQLTGNLTGEHNDEETAIASQVTFDTDTNTHLLKLTAQSGDEHNGGAYGNGARISFTGSWDCIKVDETTDGHLDHVEISNLALDISGSGNIGINFLDGGNSGQLTANRLLIKGDSDSNRGISVFGKGTPNVLITNCIIYDVGDGAGDAGLHFGVDIDTSDVLECYNNTCIGNYDNIVQDDTWPDADGFIVKNNLCQAAQNVDYRDDGSGFGTTSKNISEDATSPDVAYQSKDLHTNSVFKDYASDDFRLDSAGDATNLAIVDDGDDLSGTFTDDVEGQTRSTWYIGASEIVAAGGYTLTAESGAFSLSGIDVNLKKGSKVIVESGSFVLSGMEIGLLRGYPLIAESGSLSIAGQDVNLLKSLSINAENGVFSVIGQDVQLQKTNILVAESGAIVLTGSDVGLQRDSKIEAEAGVLTITGQDVALEYGRRILIEAGSFSILGQDADLLYSGGSPILNAESGTFIITGQEASLEHNKRLVAESTTFNINGQDVILIWSGEETIFTGAQIAEIKRIHRNTMIVDGYF